MPLALDARTGMSKKKARARAVLGDKYEFTRHPLDEMDNDELTENDVRQASLTAKS